MGLYLIYHICQSISRRYNSKSSSQFKGYDLYSKCVEYKLIWKNKSPSGIISGVHDLHCTTLMFMNEISGAKMKSCF